MARFTLMNSDPAGRSASDSSQEQQRGVEVGKMLCLGKNYLLHAREMGGDAPEQPVIFMKPSTAYLPNHGIIVIPELSHEMHHELELCAIVGKRMSCVDEEQGIDGIAGYAIGLDMTLRDVQSAAKKKGEPWTVAKGFDTSAPIGPMIHADAIPDPHALSITLEVNGEVRQQGSTSDMIFRLPFVISYLSRIFTLEPGDVIFTGTPEGVGQVVSGDRLVARIDSFPAASLEVSVK